MWLFVFILNTNIRGICLHPLFSGNWNNGAYCGSRGSNWNNSPLTLNSNIGVRGVSETRISQTPMAECIPLAMMAKYTAGDNPCLVVCHERQWL